MKCENCGKNEVTFVYRSNVNGHVEEKHLCSDCAEKLGWLTVDCCRDGQMLPIEEIHKRIMLLVEKYI